MKEPQYAILSGILAVVLLIGALILVVAGVTGVKDVLGWQVLSTGDFASGYLSAGNSAVGYLAAGDFSVGVFAAGIFSVGVFAVGIFSIGIFSIGIFNIGLFAIGIYALGKYTTQRLAVSEEADNSKKYPPATAT
jgi:hypothetical protein